MNPYTTLMPMREDRGGMRAATPRSCTADQANEAEREVAVPTEVHAPPPSRRGVDDHLADRTGLRPRGAPRRFGQREAEQWQAVLLADRQGAVADRGGDVLGGCGARLRPAV